MNTLLFPLCVTVASPPKDAGKIVNTAQHPKSWGPLI